MRRVLGPSNFGPIFWVAAVPPPGQLLKFPLWTDMDGQTIGDVRDILSTFVNETVRMPPKTQTDMTKGSLFNERSLYSLPTDDAALVLLLRGGRVCPPHCKTPNPGHFADFRERLAYREAHICGQRDANSTGPPERGQPQTRTSSVASLGLARTSTNNPAWCLT